MSEYTLGSATDRLNLAGASAGGNSEVEGKIRDMGAALRGLGEYAAQTGELKSEDLGVVMADMLADMHHLCDELGISFEQIVSQSDLYYADGN